ncbi:MAG: isocitrate/isopropylmalate dehydrogenase family protein [Planctomycetota bacterium]|jgi:tartrate dehydrogenase/decarboxylase/D-malate dehydrogenase
MAILRIAVVPGDGIGTEIIPPTLTVLQAAMEPTGGRLETTTFPFGAGHYRAHGAFMPPDGLDVLRRFDAILFGAVGLPEVDDTLPAQQYTFKIRCSFRQYVNYRPCKRYAGVPGPLRSDADFDFVIVRENNEGEFILTGSEHHLDAPEGFATQLSVFTRRGITQVARYAFELAGRRRKKLTNVTKSNTMIHSLKYWDRVIEEVQGEYADVEYEKMYVDAAAANMVLEPQRFDVILTTNMIGDILSDLGGALVGSLGLAPSGNINPEREFPSMFEPIHGSAPDIAGQGIANPIGAIESAALMLEHLREGQAADRIRSAVANTLQSGICTPDLGGKATTEEVARAVIDRLKKPRGE